MAKGLQIPISLNPKDWTRGLRVIETSLDDIRQDLKKVEQAGDDAARGMSDAFSDVGRDFQRQFDQLPQKARRAATESGDELERGLRKNRVREIGAETGSEFVESWGEAVRSGNLGGAVTETISNAGAIAASAATGLGGVFAGLGIAAAGGLINGFVQKKKALQQGITNAVSGIFDGAISEATEAGTSVASAMSKAFAERQNKEKLIIAATGTDNIVEAMTEVKKAAADAGLDWQLVFDAMTGDSKAIAEVWKGANQDSVETQGILGGGLDKIVEAGNQSRAATEEAKAAAVVYDVVLGGSETKSKNIKDNMTSAKPPDPGMPKTRADADAIKRKLDSLQNKQIQVKILGDIVASGKPGGAAAAAILRGDTNF